MSAFPDAELHIGCDSQQVEKLTEYVTVVVIHRLGKGGRVFYSREKVPRIRELRERLWKEVWRSTELAMELTSTPDIGDVEPIAVCAIHIDANVDPKHKSSKYVEELVGLVMGQGFHAMVKPEAWAASHAADHVVKHKNDSRKPFIGGGRRYRLA
jgi:predicted RNase H-related nuclease YkuK (DUF458 family)